MTAVHRLQHKNSNKQAIYYNLVKVVYCLLYFYKSIL